MKVRFLPQDVIVEVRADQSVMHAAQDAGLYIKSVCRGKPNCAECRVRMIDGDERVLPPSPAELALIGTGHFLDRRRLSCQLRCLGDVTVDLSEQVQKQQALQKGGAKKAGHLPDDDRAEDTRAIRQGPADDES
jgi:ferredoxin